LHKNQGAFYRLLEFFFGRVCAEILRRAIFLYLDLTDPRAAVLTPEIEEMGFFYAGTLPYGLRGRDALILQYLDNLRIDYGLIRVYSPWGREIIRYVMEHDPDRL
jgi:hypothetical protein